MKVGILAGGLGSRLSEETQSRPKALVEIGGRPILWHLMRYYASFGHTDFSVALGYRGEDIKRWVIGEAVDDSDLTVQTGGGVVRAHQGDDERNLDEDWRISLLDTGHRTETSGRIRQLMPHLGDSTFMLTWCDGVTDVDLDALLAFHRSHGRIATLTAVRPPPRYGHLELDGDQIVEFVEKPDHGGGGWINGAFFVFEPELIDYLDGFDDMPFERGPLQRLVEHDQLMAYRHDGFWQCMDNVNDKSVLEELWCSEKPPWKAWD